MVLLPCVYEPHYEMEACGPSVMITCLDTFLPEAVSSAWCQVCGWEFHWGWICNVLNHAILTGLHSLNVHLLLLYTHALHRKPYKQPMALEEARALLPPYYYCRSIGNCNLVQRWAMIICNASHNARWVNWDYNYRVFPGSMGSAVDLWHDMWTACCSSVKLSDIRFSSAFFITHPSGGTGPNIRLKWRIPCASQRILCPTVNDDSPLYCYLHSASIPFLQYVLLDGSV